MLGFGAGTSGFASATEGCFESAICFSIGFGFSSTIGLALLISSSLLRTSSFSGLLLGGVKVVF